MFDSSMSAAAIAARIQELQAAAGIKAQLVNPSGRGAGIITLTGWVALAALVSLLSRPCSSALLLVCIQIQCMRAMLYSAAFEILDGGRWLGLKPMSVSL